MEETRIYKFTGRPEYLDTLEEVFRHMEYLGIVGANRNLLVRVYGDYCGRIKVRNGKDERLNTKDYNTDEDKNNIVGTYDIG